MSLITDGILIAASLTACFYCLVLNIRLKALRNTKTGIGGSITQLSESVAELEASLAETKASHQHSAEKLEDLVGEAGTLADFLADLLEKADDAGLPTPTSSEQRNVRSTEPDQEDPENPEETPELSGQIEKTEKNEEISPDTPSEQDHSGSGDGPDDQSETQDDRSDPDDDVISIEMVDTQDAPLKAGVG